MFVAPKKRLKRYDDFTRLLTTGPNNNMLFALSYLENKHTMAAQSSTLTPESALQRPTYLPRVPVPII